LFHTSPSFMISFHIIISGPLYVMIQDHPAIFQS
jgi:hypothetical protein